MRRTRPRCSWTRKRLAATHDWPTLRSLGDQRPLDGRFDVGVGQTRNGALPPSSIDVRSTLWAAAASRPRPTSVDPVKETLRSRGSASSSRVYLRRRCGGDDVVDASGHASLLQQRGQRQCAQRCRFRRLVHDRAAGRQRRPSCASPSPAGSPTVHEQAGADGLAGGEQRTSPSGAARYSPPTRTASSANQRKNWAA